MGMRDAKDSVADVAILGGARSGIAAAQLLIGHGSTVFLSDSRPLEQLQLSLSANGLAQLAHEGGRHTERVLEHDLIVISPGVPSDLPIVLKAREKRIPVWSELELAYRMCESPFIAVTGSSGKSTTVSMIGAAFAASPVKGIVAGNIGIPVTHYVSSLDPATWVVAEVSSFQLETVDRFRPRVAVVLNFLKNHLDRYRSEDDYYGAKKNIARNMGREDVLVLNMHDARLEAWAGDLGERAGVAWFGLAPRGNFCVWLENGCICYCWGERRGTVCAVDTLKITGTHNYLNACAASAAALGAGIGADDIAKGLGTFEGLEHRLEFVAEIGGVRYYNDSKSTTAESVACAVSSFGRNVHLIAGGKDKGCDFSVAAGPISQHVKDIWLIGEAAGRMAKQWEGLTPVSIAPTLEEALRQARGKSEKGDVVVLSPGCSSFDMFVNYEERGKKFKELVHGME
jgi:UDP-N-acetylmuramoylalanine--D-glutamate ligase